MLMSQTRTVLSSLAVTTDWLSGLKATLLTRLVCPRSSNFGWPVLTATYPRSVRRRFSLSLSENHRAARVAAVTLVVLLVSGFVGIPDARHIPFEPHHADESAREIVQAARADANRFITASGQLAGDGGGGNVARRLDRAGPPTELRRLISGCPSSRFRWLSVRLEGRQSREGLQCFHRRCRRTSLKRCLHQANGIQCFIAGREQRTAQRQRVFLQAVQDIFQSVS